MNDKNKNILIIPVDTLGELKNMYQISHLAFIGGSFNNTGGHNPLEATICEKPVISGPQIFNFKDIYEILTKSGAAIVVKNQQEFYKNIKNILSDENIYNSMKSCCVNIFEKERGAADFVIKEMKEVIN